MAAFVIPVTLRQAQGKPELKMPPRFLGGGNSQKEERFCVLSHLLFLLEPLQETVAFILVTCTRVNEINATLGLCSLWNDL